MTPGDTPLGGINIDTNTVLRVSAEAGRLVLESGGETYRAEDTIVAISSAIGALDAESFALPTGLMVSCEDELGNCRSIVRRIRRRSLNLEKIQRVNQLARDAVSGKVELDGIERELCAIETMGLYRKPFPTLGAAMICGFFCPLFGGRWNDALCAAVIGIIMSAINKWFSGMRLPDFILNITGGLVAALAALTATSLGLSSHTDKVIIGVIMLLLPGVTIVNAIRDTIAGDFVAGIARGADAFISAAGISIGVGIGLKAWSLAAGFIP